MHQQGDDTTSLHEKLAPGTWKALKKLKTTVYRVTLNYGKIIFYMIVEIIIKTVHITYVSKGFISELYRVRDFATISIPLVISVVLNILGTTLCNKYGTSVNIYNK